MIRFLTACLILFLALVAGAAAALHLTPEPNFTRYNNRSQEIHDTNGHLLHAYLTGDQRWRLNTNAVDLPKHYWRMLIAYEDKRFYSHRGVDVLALCRALYQFARYGKPVSGASTLSMQVVRLLNPPRTRGVATKIQQFLHAVKIERRLTKTQILDIYVTLAPFGGNIEGLRAASHLYFQKEPRHLTIPEAATLIAIPQMPEARRPDRFPENAQRARDRVIERMIALQAISANVGKAATAQPVRADRHATRFLAPHLSDRLRKEQPGQQVIRTFISGSLQRQAERVASSALHTLPGDTNVALVIIENKSSLVRAYVGGADYFSTPRAGQVDLIEAVRSPGSALKPLIYGMAFERLIVHPDTIIADQQTSFGAYEPKNFSRGFSGEITIRQALVKSLNIPAVALLVEVRPERFLARLRSARSPLVIGTADADAGLAIGLGGGGLSLLKLAGLYTGLANGGRSRTLRLTPQDPEMNPAQLLAPDAAWAVTDILADAVPPSSFGRRLTRDGGRRLAFKTGTSYGFRDAWAVGYDQEHTVAVWVGRPDGAPHIGAYGITAAAPILFRVFDFLPIPTTDVAGQKPSGSILAVHGSLPERLMRFEPGVYENRIAPLRIQFPKDGSRVAIASDGHSEPLLLSAQGGTPPYTWFVGGRKLDVEHPISASALHWLPDSIGQMEVTVVDQAGRSAAVSFWLE